MQPFRSLISHWLMFCRVTRALNDARVERMHVNCMTLESFRIANSESYPGRVRAGGMLTIMDAEGTLRQDGGGGECFVFRRTNALHTHLNIVQAFSCELSDIYCVICDVDLVSVIILTSVQSYTHTSRLCRHQAINYQGECIGDCPYTGHSDWCVCGLCVCVSVCGLRSTGTV